MRTILFTITGFGALAVLYLLFKLLLLRRLKRKLHHGNLVTFKKTLGERYQVRTLLTGLTRCKWNKRWLTVKADFDQEGNLRSEINFYIAWW